MSLSNTDAIRFLAMRGRGVTVDAIIQGGLEEVSQDLDARHRTEIAALRALESRSQTEIRPIVADIESVTAANHAEERLTDLQKLVEELEIKQGQLAGKLVKKESDLKAQKELVHGLRGDLESLQKALANKQSPETAYINEFGARICESVAGQKRIPPFKVPK